MMRAILILLLAAQALLTTSPAAALPDLSAAELRKLDPLLAVATPASPAASAAARHGPHAIPAGPTRPDQREGRRDREAHPELALLRHRGGWPPDPLRELRRVLRARTGLPPQLVAGPFPSPTSRRGESESPFRSPNEWLPSGQVRVSVDQMLTLTPRSPGLIVATDSACGGREGEG